MNEKENIFSGFPQTHLPAKAVIGFLFSAGLLTLGSSYSLTFPSRGLRDSGLLSFRTPSQLRGSGGF
jgi:hypothetical protein